MQTQHHNNSNTTAVNNRRVRLRNIDNNVFRTSSFGYSYLFGAGNIRLKTRNGGSGILGRNILRDIWTLVTSPV